MKKINNANKKSVLSLSKYRFFGVDSARVALASSDAKADMLLYTPRAQVHQTNYRIKNTKQKEPLFSRNSFC